MDVWGWLMHAREGGSTAAGTIGIAYGLLALFTPADLRAWAQELLGIAVLGSSAWLIFVERRAAALRRIKAADEAEHRASLTARIEELERQNADLRTRPDAPADALEPTDGMAVT